MNGMSRVYLYRRADDQIQVCPGRHPRGDGRIETARLVVDRNEALVAARKRDRIRAVVPPVVDIASRDHVPEAHHVLDRGIAVLADPLADGGGFQAGSTADGQRPAAPVRRRAERVLRRAVEHVARENRWVAVRLGEHPYVGEPEYIAIAVADAAVVLRVVVLEKDDGLIRRHDAPRRLGKLVAGRAVRIQLRDVLAVDASELVAHADEGEFGDVGGAAGAVAFAKVVSR